MEFIVVAAILASPKHKAFTWSYCSSIYRVHCVDLRWQVEMTAFGSFWMPLSEFACQRKFYNKIHTQDILLGYLSVTMVQNGEFGHPFFISWLRPC